MKRTHRSLLLTLAYGMVCLSANGQRIDLQGAIGIALERNFDVRMATISRAVSDRLTDRGNAGLLPSVYIDGSANYLLQNTEITFANPGLEGIQADGAQTISYSAGAYMSYVLFNGGRRIHTLRRLGSDSEDARLRERMAMEAASVQVAARFLEAVLAADRAETAALSVKLSLDRVKRAGDAYRFGSLSRLEYTNAETDLRTDSLRLAESKLEVARARRMLHTAMGVPPDTLLEIDYQEYTPMPLPDRTELIRQATTSNTAYLRTRNAIYNAEEGLKAARADYLPTLSAQAGYIYNFSDFEANFLNTSENVGLNAGLNLRFYLFDGGRIKRNIETARLNSLMAATDEARTRNELIASVGNAWDEWLTSLEMLNLSRRNLALAETAYNRSLEALGTGQITGLELRTAQLNLIQATNEINLREVRAQLAELNLLFESGILLR